MRTLGFGDNTLTSTNGVLPIMSSTLPNGTTANLRIRSGGIPMCLVGILAVGPRRWHRRRNAHLTFPAGVKAITGAPRRRPLLDEREELVAERVDIVHGHAAATDHPVVGSQRLRGGE